MTKISLGKAAILVLLTLVFAGYFLSQPPMPQRLSYHEFADQRSWMGIPRVMDVLSNLPFLLVGMLGIGFIARQSPEERRRTFVEPGEEWPYAAMFAGVALVSLGSAYYHWSPGNETLTLDRLPMALGFMALFASQISDRVSPRGGALLLVPLMAVGGGTVLYWHYSEQAGVGDLRPYMFVQTSAICVIPLLLVLFPARYDRGGEMLIAVAFYGLAKVVEKWDLEIFRYTGFISGHTLKHYLAALAIFWILLVLKRRSPVTDNCTLQ